MFVRRGVFPSLLALLAASSTAGCRHAPQVRPIVKEREAARLDRLPDDRRTLDARWQDIQVQAEVHDDRVTSAATLDAPKVRIFHRPGPSSSQPPRLPISGEQLRKLFPVDVDRVTVRDGQLDYVDATEPNRPELWIHDIELSLENLTTRPRFSGGLPVLLTARATVQRSGTLTLFASADPWRRGVNAAGRASLRGLRTASLFQFLQVATGLQAPRGTIDVYVEFQIRNNQILGGVKPILRNVDLLPVHSNLLDRLKATVADVGVTLLSDDVPGRNGVASIIPIHGTLTDPQAEVWPAVVAVIRNAFVQGIAAGFSRLPPPGREARP
jgi:hypothetical protein